MKYLVVHPVTAYSLGNGRFACESAFCDHLRSLLSLLSPRFDKIVLAGVDMDCEEYVRRRKGLGIVEPGEGIEFEPLFTEGVGHREFVLRELPRALRTLNRLVGEAGLVHGTYSQNIVRPVEFPAMLLAWWKRRKTIGVVDIDYRNDPDMAWQSGRVALRKYFIERRIYEPLRRAQLRLLAERSSLLLVKEDSLVKDLGGERRENIRFMLDPGYEPEHVIDATTLRTKMGSLGRRPLEVLYFGRLVPYKGVDRMLSAVRQAVDQGADIHFRVMGVGPMASALKAQTLHLGLSSVVRFEDPIPYGPAFFARLRKSDLLLAAPLAGDTPRSTWDAFASGQGLLAFDTPFYRSMKDRTQAVRTVPWPDTEAMGNALADLARHPAQVATLQRRAAEAAQLHDQSRWLERRAEWTHALFEDAVHVKGRAPQAALAEARAS